jgi:DNA-binding protein HU-beta
MAPKPMTKAQLVAALADETGMDKKGAAGALDALTAIIVRELTGNGAVAIPGVGKIYTQDRPERMVRIPGTGEMKPKAADKAVKVTISKALKDSVNA